MGGGLLAVRIGYAQTDFSSTPTALVYGLYGPIVVRAAAFTRNHPAFSTDSPDTRSPRRHHFRCRLQQSVIFASFTTTDGTAYHIGPTHGPHNTALWARPTNPITNRTRTKYRAPTYLLRRVTVQYAHIQGASLIPCPGRSQYLLILYSIFIPVYSINKILVYAELTTELNIQ